VEVALAFGSHVTQSWMHCSFFEVVFSNPAVFFQNGNKSMSKWQQIYVFQGV